MEPEVKLMPGMNQDHQNSKEIGKQIQELINRAESAVPGLKRTVILAVCVILAAVLNRFTRLVWRLPETLGKGLAFIWLLAAFAAVQSALRCLLAFLKKRREKSAENWRGQENVVQYWGQIVESAYSGDDGSSFYRVRYCVGGSYFSFVTGNSDFRNAVGKWIKTYHDENSGRWDPDTSAVYEEPEKVILVGAEADAPSADGERAAAEATAAGPGAEKADDAQTADEKPAGYAAQPSRSHSDVQETRQPAARPEAESSSADEAEDEPVSYEESLEFEGRATPKYYGALPIIGGLVFFEIVLNNVGLLAPDFLPGLIIYLILQCTIVLPMGLILLIQLLDNLRRKKLYSGPVRKVKAVLTRVSQGGSDEIIIRCRHGEREYRKRVWGGDRHYFQKKVGSRVTVYVSETRPGLYDIAEDSLYRE